VPITFSVTANMLLKLEKEAAKDVTLLIGNMDQLLALLYAFKIFI